MEGSWSNKAYFWIQGRRENKTINQIFLKPRPCPRLGKKEKKKKEEKQQKKELCWTHLFIEQNLFIAQGISSSFKSSSFISKDMFAVLWETICITEFRSSTKGFNKKENK